VRAFHPETVESILVIRLYFIGDVLLSTPVIEALARAFPHASLAVAVKKRALDVLTGNPFVDEVIVYDAVPGYHSPVWTWRLARELRSRRFSLTVDLTGDWRSSWMVLASDPAFRVGFNHVGTGFLLDRRTPYRAEGHVVDHLLSIVEPLGATVAEPLPRMYLSDQERAESNAILAEACPGPSKRRFAMAPGANWPARRWPADRFGALAARIMGRFGLPTVVLATAEDARLADEVVAASGGAAVSLAGRTNVRTLAAVAESAAVFVGNDSGPLHIAAAVGTPVVGLFGPNTPVHFSPRGSASRVLYAGFPCSPCRQGRCERPEDGCMMALSIEQAEEAVRSLLGVGDVS
jgi:lipopolysaccharide heptosyltransferase II